MLRAHFAHAQFIVVSLKEGMFANANVVFRCKFVEGVSAVTRLVLHGEDDSGYAAAASASSSALSRARGVKPKSQSGDEEQKEEKSVS